MLVTLAIILILVSGGMLVYKARQEDGTYNWKTGAAGVLAILVAIWEAASHTITGLFN